jgi:hypothetical protein
MKVCHGIGSGDVKGGRALRRRTPVDPVRFRTYPTYPFGSFGKPLPVNQSRTPPPRERNEKSHVRHLSAQKLREIQLMVSKMHNHHFAITNHSEE